MDNWNNKQKIITQAICLLLSMGLWFYVTNIENPIRPYELTKIPVEIKNIESLKSADLVLAPNQQFNVNLRLEGNSQDLFNIDKSDFKITVDLGELALKNGENKVAVNIEEAPSNIKIKNGNGLTITVKTEAYITKEVPVKSKIEVISKSSYYVAAPVFNPQVVAVSGAESLVNNVTKVIAEGEETNATETIVKNYMLSAVDDDNNLIAGVELSQKWAEATIVINKGKTVPVKINTTGTLPNGLKIKSITSNITDVSITGPQDALDNVDEIVTEYINLSEVNDSINLNVALGIPEGIVINNGEHSIVVSIVIEKIQSKEFTIDYSLIGNVEGISVISDNNKVIIKVSGYENILNTLTEANFKAELDVSEYTEAGEFIKIPTVTLLDIDNVTIDSVGEIKLQVTIDAPTNGDNVEEESQ